MRSKRVGGPLSSLWVFADYTTDLELCPISELEIPEEREWWRDWIRKQMNFISNLQAKEPEKGYQAMRTTNQREAEFRWVYDKASSITCKCK